ncbi:MAG: hypothetical protein GXY61_03750 [Lentisphaerae bacterium]|nr:hypothetical protein [Lentisphaerota bacterium]
MTKFFHKFGFQMWAQNLVFMQLPPEDHGYWLRLRILAGQCEEEDGHIPIGAVKRAKRKDVLRFLSKGDEEKHDYFNKMIDRLAGAGALEITSSGIVRIGRYVEEQKLGRTDDTNNKRQERERQFEDRISQIRRRLTSYVKSDQGPSLNHFIKWICLEIGCKPKTADKVVDALERDHVIVVDRKNGVFSVLTLGGLAAPPLAPPAEAVTEAVALHDVSYRTCHVESETDSESDSDSYESQLNSTERPPSNNSPSASLSPDSWRAEGGASGGAAPVGCGRTIFAKRDAHKSHRGPPNRPKMDSGPPYPCDLDPYKMDVWEVDPEICAGFFCPDGDRDTWKVIRCKLKRHGEELFRQILQEMQTDIASGDWETMKSHSRVFIGKFKRYER